MYSWQLLKRSISGWVWLCFTFLTVAGSPAIFGEEVVLLPGDTSGSVSAWLNQGGPFYVLGLASNEKIHWSDKVYCGVRLQLPAGWNQTPAIVRLDYDHPENFPELALVTRISAVTLHCKVIRGNVQVDFKGFSVPLSSGQASIVDYHTHYVYDENAQTSTTQIYWRYNAPEAPQLTRTSFNGTVSGEGQDGTVQLNIALPEVLDVSFKSLNTDATQEPKDCIVAFYLELTVDEFAMHDYLINADGSLNTDAGSSAIAVAEGGYYGSSVSNVGVDPNNKIGERATVLRGSGSMGRVDLGEDPSQKLGDFGQKLFFVKEYLGLDPIKKSFEGDSSTLFSVTALELPGISVEAGTHSVQTPRISLVDDFTWDSTHLADLGLDAPLKVFRALILLVFTYYTVLRFWRAFNH